VSCPTVHTLKTTAHTPQGTIEGVLDGNGSVVIPDVGIGNVTIEVLPDVDDEIKELQNQVKTILDGVIQEERAEASKLAESYNKKSYLGKVGENLKSEAKGVGNIAVGIWDGIKAIGGAIKEVGEQAGEYLLDPLNAPETFKEDVAAVKAKYHELKHTTNQALDIYHTLKEDDDTWKMLKKFSEDYYDAQHSTEIFEHGAELTVGVILTLFTGGAAAAALGTRFAAASARLAPLLEKLAKMLKDRQWFKKRQTVEANKKETVSTVHKPKRKPRQPDKKKWKEKGGKIEEHKDGSTTYTTKDGKSVTYSKDGYPDFSPHSPEKPVKIEDMKGDHYEDYKAANQASGRTGSKAPKGYTWHHMEDGKHMQLVDKTIHRDFPHTGGASVVNNK